VDPDQLARRASDFEPLVTRLSGIHTSLTDALGAEGDCWGTDDVGRSFGAVHATPATSTLDSLSGLSTLLGSVGTRLSDSAATYRGTDDLAGDHLRAAEE
jgi:hypothetical protein